MALWACRKWAIAFASNIQAGCCSHGNISAIMGGLCSKTVPEESSSEGQPYDRRHMPSPQPWAASMHQNGQHALVPAAQLVPPGKYEMKELDQSSPLEKTALPGYDTDDVESRDDGEDKEDKKRLSRVLSQKARTAKSKTTIVAKKGAAKVSEVGSLLGRAGTAGFGKAVEALDTFSSSIYLGSGFGAGVAPKGNKIGILAFEVANTIVKGNNLKQSLSDESLQLLKDDILPSDGIQILVSRDMSKLWRITAADKRDELKVFSGEVVRFGNHCRDPQWHQLDRVFNKLGIEVTIPGQTKQEADDKMQELMTLAQNTAELYHELHALDRYQNDLKRKLEDDDLTVGSQKGDSLAILKSDFKCQQRHVKLLKKKSLWSKILEEVMEKLVDIVYYLHQQIYEAFGPPDAQTADSQSHGSQSLGALGLSLHYANIINQIDSLVSRPSSVPPNTRDNLYQGLPPAIKMSLRTRLHAASDKEELTNAQLKEEMEKILDWLVPIASNTSKAHHGFGWVGEWASSGVQVDRRIGVHELNLIQTLHHADQKITEEYILQLLVLLNLLISRVKNNANGHKSPHKSPYRSPQKRELTVMSTENHPRENSQQLSPTSELSKEDQEMLTKLSQKSRKLTPGISKSQEFKPHPKSKLNRLVKSYSHSPMPTNKCEIPIIRRASHLELDVERMKALDKIDRVDTLTFGQSSV